MPHVARGRKSIPLKVHLFSSEQQNIELPNVGRYATGILFLDKDTHQDTEAAFEKLAKECYLRVRNGASWFSTTKSTHVHPPFFSIDCFLLQVICWRDVPTDNTRIGEVARKCEPYMRQVFVTGDQDDGDLERQVIVCNNAPFDSTPRVKMLYLLTARYSS